MSNDITLVCEGTRWTGLQAVRVTKSMDQTAHSFSIATTDRFQEGVARWNVKGGSAVELFLNDDLIVSGFVNRYAVDLDADTHRVDIAGDSRAVDLVECSHKGPYFWKGVTYEQIVQDVLAPFSLSVQFSKELAPLPETGFRVAVDSAAFDIVRKIAELNALTVISDTAGEIRLTDGSDATGGTVLGRGDYVALKVAHDISRAHSEVIVKSQRNDFGSNHDLQQSEKVVTNDAQSRYRPLVLIHTGEPDRFAQYAAQRFQGDSIAANITVKSAYDKQGRLWDINQKVWLAEPLVDIDNELIIADYELSVDEQSGLNVTLGLRLPQTYAPSGEGGTLFERRAVRRSGGFFADTLAGLVG